MAEKMTPEKVWNEFEAACTFKAGLNLYENVQANENFYIGKQWEGVQANGLPTPVFNFIKRIILYVRVSGCIRLRDVERAVAAFTIRQSSFMQYSSHFIVRSPRRLDMYFSFQSFNCSINFSMSIRCPPQTLLPLHTFGMPLELNPNLFLAI